MAQTVDTRSRPYDWTGYLIHAVLGAVIGGGIGFLCSIRYGRRIWHSWGAVSGDLVVLSTLVPAIIVGAWAGYLRDRYWLGDDGVRERDERGQNDYPAHMIALGATFITLTVLLWKVATVALELERLRVQGPARFASWSYTALSGAGAAWAGWTLWRVRREHHEELRQRADRAT